MSAKGAVQEAELDIEIDWEARFLAQVADGIKSKATCSAKLAEAQLELDKANATIKRLEKRVKDLEPMSGKLDAERAARKKSDESWAAKMLELETKNKALNKVRAQGQRAVMEDVALWLQTAINKLPEPIREPEIDLDPPSAGVFE